jgi:hypothetical protein
MSDNKVSILDGSNNDTPKPSAKQVDVDKEPKAAASRAEKADKNPPVDSKGNAQEKLEYAGHVVYRERF